MIKYILKCHNDHEFESWFSNSEEFENLNKKKLLECIYCSSKKINKSIMAPMVSGTKEKKIEIQELNKNLVNEKNKLLKKNGIMFTATLNRSFTSYIKAIIGAEYLLRWLPIGTHDWNKFIKPEELEKILNQEKFSTLDIKGLKFNPLFKKWKRSNDLSVNYIICSVKN